MIYSRVDGISTPTPYWLLGRPPPAPTRELTRLMVYVYVQLKALLKKKLLENITCPLDHMLVIYLNPWASIRWLIIGFITSHTAVIFYFIFISCTWEMLMSEDTKFVVYTCVIFPMPPALNSRLNWPRVCNVLISLNQNVRFIHWSLKILLQNYKQL